MNSEVNSEFIEDHEGTVSWVLLQHTDKQYVMNEFQEISLVQTISTPPSSSV